MDIYRELFHVHDFRKALEEYRAEIQQQGLSFLGFSLMNYEAEGSWLEGMSAEYFKVHKSDL